MSHACNMHSVTHRCVHRQPCTLPRGHCPSSSPLVPIAFLPFPSLFPGPGLLCAPCVGAGCVSCPPALKHPRMTACPWANVPLAPNPCILSNHSHLPVTPCHFPGAPSDKFIKLRDDTVNGHIKKREEEGGGGGAQNLP